MGVAPHLRLGREGEAVAEALLTSKGYTVLARNFQTRSGEVDLICRDGDTLVFVEVKTRGAGSRGRPEEAVTVAKQKRIIRAAAEFLSQRDWWSQPCRFDVVAISVHAGTHTATHLPDAFTLGEAPENGRFYQPG